VAFICKEFPGRRFTTVGELRALRAIQLLAAAALAARRERLKESLVVSVEATDGKENPEEEGA